MTIYTRALSLVHRLTGREAAALHYQRDAHAEEAGRERQRRMEAERERDTFRTALQTTIGVAKQWERDCEEAVALLQRLTTARDEHALADAATWLRAQNFAALAADRKVRGGAPVSAPMDLDVSDRDMWPDHHAEQEGSRGGIAWMPGEALPDE